MIACLTNNDMIMPESTSEIDKVVRKLRKKLRQIERLESINRPLNEEETHKVTQKESIRLQLGDLLVINNTQFNAGDINGMSQKHKNSNEEENYNNNMKRSVEQSCSAETELQDNIEHKRPRSSNENSAQDEEKNNCHSELSPSEPSKNDYFFGVKRLNGHSDLVCCVDMNKNVIISGGRDTTVRIWNIHTGKEIQILRGHSNTVTCVLLLSEEQSLCLCRLLDCGQTKQLALTASLDCCFKLWSIEEGLMLKSVYTYSGIKSLGYLSNHQFVAIGSEGGKLEVYSLLQDHVTATYSVQVCNDVITCIKIDSGMIVCSSFDGIISIWMIPEDNNPNLRLLYRSENLQSCSVMRKQCKRIRCLAATSNADSNQKIYFADEGTNIKLLCWKTGLVRKLKNHINGNGFTNALCATNSRLFATCIDLDTGHSFLHVRSLNEDKYLFSVNTKRTECIVSLVAWEDDEEEIFRVVTGGSRLMLYEGSTRHPSGNRVLKSIVLPELSVDPEDSEDSSLSSSSETDQDFTDEEEEPMVEKNSFRLCHLM